MQAEPCTPLAAPIMRGVHHLALCTDDMKATVDFYVDVLGMPLVHAMKVPPGLGTAPGNRGNPPYEEVRHYFFDMGNDSLLAFFEIPKGQEPAGNRNAIGAMQHCAFVVTAARFREVEARLKGRGIDYIGPIPQLPRMLEAEQDKSRRAAAVDPLVDASSCSTTCPTAFGPFPYGLRRPCGR
jgi:catechol 2,3-dioxygenase-like lactoylglutathione lyase family enzyme